MSDEANFGERDLAGRPYGASKSANGTGSVRTFEVTIHDGPMLGQPAGKNEFVSPIVEIGEYHKRAKPTYVSGGIACDSMDAALLSTLNRMLEVMERIEAQLKRIGG